MKLRKLIRATVALIAVAIAIAGVGLVVAWRLSPLPEEFLRPVSGGPLVLDRAGRPLLGLTDAEEQWARPVRLPEVSPWLVRATLAIEDRRFFEHRGVDPFADSPPVDL